MHRHMRLVSCYHQNLSLKRYRFKTEETVFILTQWPMGDVEEQGLLKMDFLGLRNLTLLDRIRRLIQQDKGVRIDFEKIPLDDEKNF